MTADASRRGRCYDNGTTSLSETAQIKKKKSAVRMAHLPSRHPSPPRHRHASTHAFHGRPARRCRWSAHPLGLASRAPAVPLHRASRARAPPFPSAPVLAAPPAAAPLPRASAPLPARVPPPRAAPRPENPEEKRDVLKKKMPRRKGGVETRR